MHGRTSCSFEIRRATYGQSSMRKYGVKARTTYIQRNFQVDRLFSLNQISKGKKKKLEMLISNLEAGALMFIYLFSFSDEKPIFETFIKEF